MSETLIWLLKEQKTIALPLPNRLTVAGATQALTLHRGGLSASAHDYQSNRRAKFEKLKIVNDFGQCDEAPLKFYRKIDRYLARWLPMAFNGSRVQS